MKKVIALALLLAMMAALVGCTTSNAAPGPTKQPINGHFDAATFPPEKPNEGLALGSVLFWETFRNGSDPDHRLTYRVYSDSKEFLNDFPDRGEAFDTRYGEEGFNDMFVVAVFITVNTGGYSFAVDSGTAAKGAVKLDIKQTAPDAGSQVTQAFETHCILAAFPIDTYSEGMKVAVTINGKTMSDLPSGGDIM